MIVNTVDDGSWEAFKFVIESDYLAHDLGQCGYMLSFEDKVVGGLHVYNAEVFSMKMHTYVIYYPFLDGIGNCWQITIKVNTDDSTKVFSVIDSEYVSCSAKAYVAYSNLVI